MHIGPRTHGPASNHAAAAASADKSAPIMPLILRALQEMAGFQRGLFYDVPRAGAPRPLPGTPVFLQGSPAWSTFVRTREQLDDGALTLLLALRPLDAAERLLAVDWGNTYANCFLLVEPADPACDLTDPNNPVRRRVERIATDVGARHAADLATDAPWTRATRLGAAARELFGVWLRWSGPPPTGQPVEEPVRLDGPDDTVAGALLPRLRRIYPEEAFEEAYTRLLEREPELFMGRSVARARSPFHTRLGLPVLHDAAVAARALRALVNDGRLWVYQPEADLSFNGPHRPVPDSMPDEQFAGLVL
jgi:hypothetical protein